MASNAAKTPMFRAIASRCYCSHSTNPISGTLSEVKTTVLPNKVVVASAETGSPISRLSIIYKAGSRYETHDNYGVTHTLRIAAGLSTKNATQFAIIRNLQQVGASLTCTTDRETVAYNLTGTLDAVKHGSEFLGEVATNQVFKPWEVSDSLPRMKLELATMPPEVRAINFLHKAAFRGGLGNSLFCAKHQVGKISSETLQHYVTETFGGSRAAVVGLGVDHAELVAYAKNLGFQSGDGRADSTKYHGGEIRSEKGGDLAYVAVGTEGGLLINPKEALAFAVLQRALGTSTYVKWGVESSSLLNKAVAGAVGENPFAVSALNNCYTDSGLFGVFAIAPADIAGNVVKSAVQVLRSGNVSDKDVQRAKNQVKFATLLALESGESCVSMVGQQALFLNCVQSPSEAAKEIDAIQTMDVQKAAKKVAAGKLSIASVGNLKTVPYLDELK